MVVGAMHRLVLVSLVVALGAIALVAMCAEAHDDKYKTIIAVDSLHYRIGDTVEVSVWTLNRGVLEDPVELAVWVGEAEEPLGWSKVTTGRYSAEFTLAGSHLDGRGRLPLGATGTFLNSTSGALGESHESDEFLTDLANTFQLCIIVPDIEDGHVGTCQTVDFWVKASFRGDPVDLDPGSLVIGGSFYDLTVVRTGRGLYECTFEIPELPWLNASCGLLIDAKGNYTIDGWTAQGDDQSMVLLDFFHVWFHKVRVTETEATVEVFVLDRGGAPIEGAEVTLEYRETGGDVHNVEGTLIGITDVEGGAPFSIDCSDLDASSERIRFEGRVEHGGKSQDFVEAIDVWDIPTGPAEHSDRPDELFSSYPLPPDTVVTLNDTVAVGAQPIPPVRRLVCVWSQKGLCFSSELYSDILGNISVTFRTPSLEPNETSLDLRIEEDNWAGNEWQGSQSYFGRHVTRDLTYSDYSYWGYWLDASMAMSVAGEGVRGPVRVVMDHPLADGTQEKAGIAWGYGMLPQDTSNVDPPWRWTNPINWFPYGPLFWVSVVECHWTGFAYEALIEVPDFIGNLTPMWFYGAVQFLDSPITDVRGVAIENVTPPILDNGPPGLTVEQPVAGGLYWGTIEAHGTTWDDYYEPLVEVRIDGGEWMFVAGGRVWNLTIDTTTMAWGEHTLEARSFDGFLRSEVVRITFSVDNPPGLPTADLPGQVWLMGTIIVNGTAPDDGGVVLVEARTDGGQWRAVEGTSVWSLALDTTGLACGPHTLEVRSYDGTHDSETLALPFLVDNPPTVELVGEWDGATVWGTVELTGTSGDDGEVIRVEVRLGAEGWMTAEGTTAWRYSLDTSTLDYGDVQFTARAFDGRLLSQELTVTLHVDNPPAIMGTDLDTDERLDGVKDVHGTAKDDRSVDYVEFQVDGGGWARADGTEDWTCTIDTGPLASGIHSLGVRAFDGTHTSKVFETAFIVDRTPVVTVTAPKAGDIWAGTMQVKGRASDDGEVEYVEVSLDAGTWRIATGAVVWSYALDTTDLVRGIHRIAARAFDGALYSQRTEVEFEVDQPPSLVVLAPSGMGPYTGTLRISGTASDDGPDLLVEWRLDGGPWHLATGSTDWSDSIDCDVLLSGSHTLEVRCYDGLSHSPVQIVTFEVVGGGGGGSGDAHWASTYTVVLAIMVVLAIAAILYWRMRRE